MRVAYKSHLKDFILDVDFEIPDQGVTILFGPSGSGKSSLLNLISGLDNQQLTEFSYFKLNGMVYDDTESKIKLKPWKRKIAYVFQDHRLFPHMTVRENILFGQKRRGSTLQADAVINTFKITDLLSHYPQQLSGGQKQRVSMVRALLSNPELLILDEPLGALDYRSKQEILPYIECIPEQLDIPVIYVSHDIKEVLRLAEHIVIIDRGEIVETGKIEDLCTRQPLLTQQEGASFILQGKINRIIEDDQLIQVNCDEIDVYFSDQSSTGKYIPGQRVRILIHAKDVSLCLSVPEDSSILNCVPVVVSKVEKNKNGKLYVTAYFGKQVLLAIISHKSARVLNIEAGKKIYAQFKATAMIK